jgi:hypothetical protein
MKLYYAPAACSLAAHIAAREAGLDLALESVDLGEKNRERSRLPRHLKGVIFRKTGHL